MGNCCSGPKEKCRGCGDGFYDKRRRDPTPSGPRPPEAPDLTAPIRSICECDVYYHHDCLDRLAAEGATCPACGEPLHNRATLELLLALFQALHQIEVTATRTLQQRKREALTADLNPALQPVPCAKPMAAVPGVLMSPSSSGRAEGGHNDNDPGGAGSILSAGNVGVDHQEDEEEGDEGWVCAICQDDDADGCARLPCSHVFHLQCVDPWLMNEKRECPLCRAEAHPTRIMPPESSSAGDDPDANGGDVAAVVTTPRHANPIMTPPPPLQLPGGAFDVTQLPPGALTPRTPAAAVTPMNAGRPRRVLTPLSPVVDRDEPIQHYQNYEAYHATF